ncbi:MAG: hypothetical protein WAV67_11670 [Dokdonella sp.]
MPDISSNYAKYGVNATKAKLDKACRVVATTAQGRWRRRVARPEGLCSANCKTVTLVVIQ